MKKILLTPVLLLLLFSAARAQKPAPRACPVTMYMTNQTVDHAFNAICSTISIIPTVNSSGNSENSLYSATVSENTRFTPLLGNVGSVIAKKGTEVSFFSNDYSPIQSYDSESSRQYKDMYNQSRGTVKSLTLAADCYLMFYGYRNNLALNIPAGSQIEFQPRLYLMVNLYSLYNWVCWVKLGRDINYPGLGLLKKGTVLHTNYGDPVEGIEPFYGKIIIDKPQ